MKKKTLSQDKADILELISQYFIKSFYITITVRKNTIFVQINDNISITLKQY